MSVTLKVPTKTLSDKFKLQDFKDDLVSLCNVVNDVVFQTASGTATAIVLTINSPLVNGYPVTFIASANNSGAATTINTKPLYKPGTTTAPTLIAGKAYTVWYNLASNCFFIKASTEGTATAAQVLAGVSFSNDEDVNIPGEMENFNNTDVYAMQISNITEGEFGIPCPITGYIGTDTIIYVNDAYFSKNNIKNGVTMFGMIGEYDKEVTNPITAAKVLAPSVGFVNGAKVTGSMINKTGTTEYPSGIAINGMTANTYDTQFRVSIPTGYHESSFIAPRIPNCIPSYIKKGIKVGCDSAGSPYVITGTLPSATEVNVGDTVVASSDAEVSGYPLTATKKKDIKINGVNGFVRVKFDLNSNVAGKQPRAQIYVNGYPIGTVRTNATTSYITFTEDITVSANDLVQLYIWNATDTTFSTFVRNFRICAYVLPVSYTVNM